MPMITVENVSKHYGGKLAVDHVTFELRKGEVLGFLGRNGAGKSTTMNIITGYISASEGRVLLDGRDILDEPRFVKRHIGYLPEQPPLYMDMTVTEYLQFVCAIKEVRKSTARAHLDELLALTGLEGVRRRLIKNLSKGYKQRVGIAQALVGNPPVVILDEPTIGLDPMQIIEVRSLIKRLREDHAVVFSSHILAEATDVCDRVIIINKGKIVASDLLSHLSANGSETRRLALRVSGHEEAVRGALIGLAGVRSVEPLGAREADSFDCIVIADRQADIRRELFYMLARLNAPLLMLRPLEPTLEEVFLRLTSESEEA